MDVTPIKTAGDYQASLAEIERLWDAEPDTPAGDRLDILAILVEAYERRHHPMPPADPIAAIAFMMEQRGMTRADLEPIMGSSGRVSEVMNRRRALFRLNDPPAVRSPANPHGDTDPSLRSPARRVNVLKGSGSRHGWGGKKRRTR
ncbi:MAG: hypothetical protein P4M00_24650 [Azospirillaceae bacterium]|nr:hypothetical protein [Azospirillaceae bacterium]